MNFATLVNKIIGLASPFVALIIGLGVVYFAYGVSQFILASGEEDKVTAAKETMTWGIIALFVMVAMWGLVHLVAGTFFTPADNAGVDNNLVQQLQQ